MVHGDLVYDKMFHKYCDVREYIGIGIVRVERDERLADERYLEELLLNAHLQELSSSLPLPRSHPA